MLKSRENWVELILQLTCLYVMVAGGCMIRIQGQVAVLLELDMMMLPLAAILYWMRRLFPTFFTNMILSIPVTLIYGMAVWWMSGLTKQMIVMGGFLLLYSLAISFKRTSLRDYEHIPEIFIFVPVILYSVAVWKHIPAYEHVFSAGFALMIVLQMIYHFRSRVGAVLDEAVENQKQNQKALKVQILLVTKMLTGALCAVALAVIFLVRVLLGDALSPFRNYIAWLLAPVAVEMTTTTAVETEEGTTEAEVAQGDIKTQTGKMEAPKVKPKRSWNLRWIYVGAWGVFIGMIFIVLSVFLNRIRQLRRGYVIERDQFEALEEAESEEMEKKKDTASASKENVWKGKALKQRQVKMKNNKQIVRIKENIAKVIVGKERVVDQVLVALLSEGHILLEDVPGTGKTMLAKTFAKSIGVEFHRIQFTADLLPTDVTGLNFYHQQTGEFTLKKGPIFSNLILADEINRATPKEQSALIECMEEHQVTVDGETRVLDAPFMVIATENPIEQTGTFPLPEAQLDRFLIKVSMGYPDKEEELEIVDKFLLDSPINHLGQVCSREEVLHMIQEAKQVKVDDQIRQLAVQLVEMTRSSQTIEIGASPRATLALMRAIRSYAYIHGRNTCCAEDVKAMAVSVLAHRIKLKPMNLAGTKSQEAVIEQLVAELFA